VDMLHALHSEFCFSTKEWVDFETALALDPKRETGRVERRFVPRSYRSAVAYTEQVERYFRTFGRDRVHIVLFDDFRRDVPGEYRCLCEFLRVDADFSPGFTVVNPNKRMRSRSLGHFLRRPPESVRRAARATMPRPVRSRFWRAALNANRVSEARSPMPAHLRRRLEDEFEPEVTRLSELIERDLSSWYVDRTPSGAKAAAHA
jgi:hypothetical protein